MPESSLVDGETLWDGLREYVHSTLGVVGISKMRGTDPAQFPWVAQDFRRPGPWTVAASEQEAREVARIENLGYDWVASFFMARVETVRGDRGAADE